ncbi:hypothetical protein [Ferrimonas balearica]|uniref:hypothetical protein n=1 Tax=Ferrimonas balearica TaxID=44012 RepID=UPI001F477531|nr:hypothetical protein [Ferrimonas balearica]MBY6093811.1 hypothetical protein [Ferrimonas balearica]
MERQLLAAGVPEFQRELKFLDNRRFRADFGWGSPHMLILEVEGGIWTGGRHTSGVGFQNDCEKYSLAGLAGYTVLRCTGKHIKDGSAIQWVTKYFEDARNAGNVAGETGSENN